MPNTTDLIGKKFNKLTVIEFAEVRNGKAYWKCRCECGKETIILRGNLPKTKSCGCLLTTNKFRGKFSKSLRDCYYNMRKRCNSTNSKSYKDYGARGITYCEKWSTFEGFLDDMLESYQEGLTLDRIDVNKCYCKENCRWATKKVQANNTRTNNYHEINGEILTTAQIADKYNLDYELFRHRLKKGWTLERAMKYVKSRETITYNGITKTVSEFADEYGMTYHQLKKRLMRGWSIEKALTQPLRKRY